MEGATDLALDLTNPLVVVALDFLDAQEAPCVAVIDAGAPMQEQTVDLEVVARGPCPAHPTLRNAKQPLPIIAADVKVDMPPVLRVALLPLGIRDVACSNGGSVPQAYQSGSPSRRHMAFRNACRRLEISVSAFPRLPFMLESASAMLRCCCACSGVPSTEVCAGSSCSNSRNTLLALPLRSNASSAKR